MRSVNLPSGAERNVNAGHVWKEVISSGSGTIILKSQQTFRVRAAAATTVTLDGELAMTMAADEVEYFNVGSGVAENGLRTVEVIVTGTAFVQVSEILPPGRRTP